MAPVRDMVLSCLSKAKILKWHVKPSEVVKKEKVLATYIFTEKITDSENFIVQRKLKAKFNGKVVEMTVNPNEEVSRGQVVIRLQEETCVHSTIMKDMCCDCGADLRKEPGIPGDLNVATSASVPVVHNILELKVSKEEAERLARLDEKQLLKARKLVLVVDLDMTLIHTTIAKVHKDSEDIFSFTLPGHQYEYHTKLRPGARKFLESISKFYELHIFTMGSRMYAHTVAKCLDPDGKFFAHRIRSRDEFLNSYSKFHDLKALFPCGDHMVCIIDDREDVWHFAPNLIVVKPYKYFKGTDDVNNPFATETKTSTIETDTNSGTDDIEKTDKNTKYIQVKGNENLKEGKNAATVNNDCKDSAKENGVAVREGEKASSNPTPATASNATESTSNNGANSTQVANDASSKEGEKGGEITAENTQGRVDLDDFLFYLDEILERVHFSFYSTLDAVKAKGGSAKNDADVTKFCTPNTLNPDSRVILPELRRQTLKGCNLVFTGVVPTNVSLEKSKAWRIAISLGARVTNEIVARKNATDNGLFTTHVVAARHGTQKAHKASRTKDIFLVNPNWLWCASERWEWPEEGIFPVPILDDKKSPVPSRQSTPQHNSFEQKSKKQISPLVGDGFELAGGYDPDNFLEKLNPLSAFSKQELDAMDKEVEELMSGNNSEDDDADKSLGSVSSDENSLKGSQKRKKVASSDDGDSILDEQENLKKKLLKSVKKLKQNEQNSRSSSSSSSSDDGSDNDDGDENKKSDNSSEDSTSSNGSSSSNSDDNSEDEQQMGSLLERHLSEAS
ncbi:RNA polymerase II subunit A C-terminal domain phosphatase-like isoform X2 [Hydractinia symbiolongicarpus]|uniref:RNA polymerase II subunit A C-terminal domain phosphatase-like isoform X2 n=1 Tax=Hydractinia symbiolongicarpus TaxID=13093 RepID=UPI00254D2A99|nr:RNA polymerase II subunit A C-terminal domain phosphatase-like isoform X2 [Hydractinia symbiolongicarpus]